MKGYFENGITQDSIINALEYVFQNILFPRDVDFEPEPEQEPGDRISISKGTNDKNFRKQINIKFKKRY